MGFLVFARTVSASANLEVSNTSDYSNSSTNFSSGQTIFVRMVPDFRGISEGVLNLRDGQENILNSFHFKNEGTYFSAIIPSPYRQGFYSLEGVIKNDALSTFATKAFTVGDPTNAGVSFNVGDGIAAQVQPDVLSERVGSEPQFYNNESNTADEKGLTDIFILGLKEIFRFIWPFK